MSACVVGGCWSLLGGLMFGAAVGLLVLIFAAVFLFMIHMGFGFSVVLLL